MIWNNISRGKQFLRLKMQKKRNENYKIIWMEKSDGIGRNREKIISLKYQTIESFKNIFEFNFWEKNSTFSYLIFSQMEISIHRTQILTLSACGAFQKAIHSKKLNNKSANKIITVLRVDWMTIMRSENF